jgi:hypothetical protein
VGIPTRTEWQHQRDAAGGKANLVRSVNVGKLLDAYDHAGGDARGTAARLRRVRLVKPLLDGLKKYRAGLPAGYVAVQRLVDEMIGEVQREIREGERAALPIAQASDYLRKVLQHSLALSKNGDPGKYATMWQEDVRGLAIGLREATKMEPGIAASAKAWDKFLVGEDWDVRGKKVAKGLSDASAIKGAVEYASREIQRVAVGIRDDLKKLNLIR